MGEVTMIFNKLTVAGASRQEQLSFALIYTLSAEYPDSDTITGCNNMCPVRITA